MVKKEKICLLKIPIKLQIIHSIHVKAQTRVKKYRLYTVPNPELEISGGGEGGLSQAPPLDPSLVQEFVIRLCRIFRRYEVVGTVYFDLTIS